MLFASNTSPILWRRKAPNIQLEESFGMHKHKAISYVILDKSRSISLKYCIYSLFASKQYNFEHNPNPLLMTTEVHHIILWNSIVLDPKCSVFQWQYLGDVGCDNTTDAATTSFLSSSVSYFPRTFSEVSGKLVMSILFACDIQHVIYREKHFQDSWLGCVYNSVASTIDSDGSSPQRSQSASASALAPSTSMITGLEQTSENGIPFFLMMRWLIHDSDSSWSWVSKKSGAQWSAPVVVSVSIHCFCPNSKQSYWPIFNLYDC